MQTVRERDRGKEHMLLAYSLLSTSAWTPYARVREEIMNGEKVRIFTEPIMAVVSTLSGPE
jgi:hypothetical protein